MLVCVCTLGTSYSVFGKDNIHASRLSDGQNITSNQFGKNPKNTKNSLFPECLLRHGVLRGFVCSVRWFLYGPFCHGALKLDISTLFTTFFL